MSNGQRIIDGLKDAVARLNRKSDLNALSPSALSAAMRGGTAGWGQWGSSLTHVRYAEPIDPRSRRRCHCGCKRRATHVGKANGVALTDGCELSVARWVKSTPIDSRR